MCKRWGLIGLLILTQFAGQLNALQVKGVMHNGMTFSGHIIRLQDGFIEFKSSAGNQSQIMGIPISQVQSLQLADDKLDPGLLVKLEPFLALLPILNAHAHGIIMAHLESMANNQQWSRLYQWTGYLQGITLNEATHIPTLRAWALMEMGLRQRAGELLASMESCLDPLEASGLYCWLRARIAFEDNLLEEARYWATLPSLTIPAYEGNFSTKLEEIRKRTPSPKPS
jgi:hypothetical protein